MLDFVQPDYSFRSTAKVLYPNTGNYAVHEGFSERFDLLCSEGWNCADLNNLSMFAEVPGERVIVSAWGR